MTSQIEHPAVLGSCRALETQGFRVTRLPLRSAGMIDPDDLAKALTDDTLLVTLMHANNEVGTIQSIQACAALARSRGILVHTDAVQSVGKIPTLVDDLGVDLPHALRPQDSRPQRDWGALCRRGTVLDPIITGGPQERGLRGGTEHVAAIVGLGLRPSLRPCTCRMRCRRSQCLRDRLEQGFQATIPDVLVNGATAPRLPTTTNISFKGVDGQSLVVALDLKGVATSTGSACSSGSLEPSHVLIAMGLADEWLQGAVRFSLGSGNTLAEVDAVLHMLPPTVARLRQYTRGSVRQATMTPSTDALGAHEPR